MRIHHSFICGLLATTALVGGGSDSALADKAMVSSGTDKSTLTISGHVNRGIMVVDDGEDTNTFFVDTGTSESRLTVIGSSKISEDLTAKAVIEVRFEENASDLVSQATEDGPTNATDRGIGIRHSYISFSSKRFGTLTTGQASDAGDNVMGADLSGTFLSGVYSEFTDVGFSMNFQTDAGASSSVTLGGAWLVGDGTRQDLIKYDSPSFGGLALHASVTQGDRRYFAGSYSAAFGDYKVAAALGYAKDILTSIDKSIAGSASVLHDSGISVTVAFTAVDEWGGLTNTERDNGLSLYGKLGYQANLFDIGKSAFAIGYANSQDSVSDGSELEVLQFGYVQHVDAAATELYLSVSHADYSDDTGNGYQEMVTGIIGSRIKF